MSKRKREVYVAVDEDNVIAVEHESVNAVLSRAQRLAEQSETPCSFLIEREPVIGKRETTHRVERSKEGVVFTIPKYA